MALQQRAKLFLEKCLSKLCHCFSEAHRPGMNCLFNGGANANKGTSKNGKALYHKEINEKST